MAGVDDEAFDAVFLEHLVEGDPVVARALHGHGGDGALLEPLHRFAQVFVEGAEGANWFGVAICGHCQDDFFSADVDAGSVRVAHLVEERFLGFGLFLLRFLGHGEFRLN